MDQEQETSVQLHDILKENCNCNCWSKRSATTSISLIRWPADCS